MKEAQFVRVCCRAIADVGTENDFRVSLRKEIRGRVNALETISPVGKKRTLNAVVEVQYTTGRLEVAG